jgi:xylose isomerase
MDALARALLAAAELINSKTLSQPTAQRYAGWSTDLGQRISAGDETLDSLEAVVMAGELNPTPVSGQQELLENRVNRVIWSSGN